MICEWVVISLRKMMDIVIVINILLLDYTQKRDFSLMGTNYM